MITRARQFWRIRLSTSRSVRSSYWNWIPGYSSKHSSLVIVRPRQHPLQTVLLFSLLSFPPWVVFISIYISTSSWNKVMPSRKGESSKTQNYRLIHVSNRLSLSLPSWCSLYWYVGDERGCSELLETSLFLATRHVALLHNCICASCRQERVFQLKKMKIEEDRRENRFPSHSLFILLFTHPCISSATEDDRELSWEGFLRLAFLHLFNLFSPRGSSRSPHQFFYSMWMSLSKSILFSLLILP